MVAILLALVQVGAAPIDGADVIHDGTAETLHAKWTYWKGPRFASSLPIKWKIVDDPVDDGTAVMSTDPKTPRGKYGTSDIVTKKKYRDFRLHIEFLVAKKGGNSGVYLQNRYEILVLDGNKTKHGMGAVINETGSPYHLYNGTGTWNAYDIQLRAARFTDGKLSKKALVTVFFNGTKAHTNVTINKVWGGANSGIDGGNDKGRGITDVPGGLKLQNEGHEVLYRNTWIKEMNFEAADTDFALAGGSLIFDGKTLEGWTVLTCDAVVKDGAIFLRGGNGVVHTNRKYTDFILDLEWKALKEDKWDSGIYFRCGLPPKGKHWPRRYQANMRKGQEGNVGGVKGAKSKGLIKPGEWNRFKMTVKGTTVSMEINGKKAYSADGLKEPTGYIALQAEIPGGGQFLFRNIRLKELGK